MNKFELLDLQNWAVVGATQDTSKFGYKVFNKLKTKGYNVYPVNPKLDELDGVKCYHSISDIEAQVDVINLIVNPKVGMGVIEAAKEKGIKNIWCQPGAESPELIEKAKSYGMNIIYNECVLVELG
ncbi:MAG: CoA-binding protein [Clostridia bacterium]|jgi:predicted CoA-binding protein|nr:CoA-binding protein [Clostridia bacterium]